jgi:osmotically-inducible protein OsmY
VALPKPETARVRLPLLAPLVLIAATAPLEGCAAYQALRSCGLHGCPEDAKIDQEVRARLAQHPALGPPNQIYVQTLAGVVYLSGQVATGLQRDTAVEVAGQAAGAHRVVDTIALGYTGR